MDKKDTSSKRSSRTGKTYTTAKGRAMADIASRTADRNRKDDSGQKKKKK